MLNFQMNTIDGLHLVHLLDGWAGPGTSRGSSTSTGHSTAGHSSHVRHASTWSSPGRLVELGDDGVADGLHLLLLLLELLDLSQLVGVILSLDVKFLCVYELAVGKKVFHT